MKLRDINFTSIRNNGYIGLAIMQAGNCLAEGFIGDVLKSIPQLALCDVKVQRHYFNVWVVELV